MEKRRTGLGIKLSPSSINTYRSCPRKFYFQRIAKVEPLPSKNQEALDRGKEVHKIIAHYYEIIPNSLTPKEVELFVVKAMKNLGSNREMVEAHIRGFTALEKTRLSWAVNPKPISVEEKLEKGFLRGIVDATFKKGTSKVVVDWKTGYSYNPQLSEALLIQSGIYKLLTGADEVYFGFVTYRKLMKVPKVDMGWLKEKVKEVYYGIQNQEFERNENEYCDMCEFNLMCWAEKNNLTIWSM